MKTRVLVVDDDRLVADTLSLIYRTNGYEAEARYSAADGLDCVRQFSPDLILCDVTMPLVNGFELAERARSLLPDVRLLLITAYRSREILAPPTSKVRPPFRVLEKPCRPDDLLRETRAVLEA